MRATQNSLLLRPLCTVAWNLLSEMRSLARAVMKLDFPLVASTYNLLPRIRGISP